MTMGIAPRTHVIALAAAWTLLATGAAKATPTIVRADSGTATAATAAAGVPLLVRLEGGDTLELLGRRLVSTGGARVYVVTSSEYARFALVSGDAAVDDLRLRPGDAAVGTLSGGRLRRMSFDAGRLSAEAPPGIATEIGPALAPVTAGQRRRRFLGALSTAVAPSASAAALEEVRRSYLAEPAVMSLRVGAGDPAALDQAVTQRFLSALAVGDRSTVAALLDPTPFLAGGANWQDARAAFADTLIAGGTGAPFAGSERQHDGRFRTTIAGRAMLVRLVRHDGMPFVAALEPAA